MKWRVVLLASAFLPQAAFGSTYYVSPAGDDSGDGLSPASAWKSVAKVDNTAFAPGSEILFQRGGEWREQLSASSSGTTDAPIIYGAYGSGSKPKFWGSDALPNSAFGAVAGTSSTYVATVHTPVNALFANHDFVHDATLLTHSSDFAVNRAYVDANPNTWLYDNGKVYMNAGGLDPSVDGRAYTAAVRDDIVYTNQKNNLVFRDLVVDESAKRDAGYAFRVFYSDNVIIENSEAYRAGKHTFGVINSDNFTGKGLLTSGALPDQGYGGATAYAAFSDGAQSNHDNSQWIDCVADKNDPTYPAFYTHGTGVGDVTVKNMTVHGGPGIVIGTEAPYHQNITVKGGTLDGAGMTIYGHDVLVDGVRINGPTAFIDLVGSDNTIQNLLMKGLNPQFSYRTAILDRGMRNRIQFNTIILDDASPYGASAIALTNAATDSTIIGNILDVPVAAVRQYFQGEGAVNMDYNLISDGAGVFINDSAYATIAQWRSQGHDLHSLLTDPSFMDAPGGDFHLTAGAAGTDLITDGTNLPAYDFGGLSRPTGGGYEAGAFETPVPEPLLATAFAPVLAAFLLCRRRRSAMRR